MDLKVLFVVFGTVFLAELGDKTQLATVLFAAARDVGKYTVFLADSAALVVSAALGMLYDKEVNDAGDRVIFATNFYYEAPVQVADGLPGFNAGGQEAAFAAARPFRREVNELSASLTYAMDMGLELTIWGRNLLDDRYITTIFDSVAQSGSISGYPNQPRTYGAAVKYKF